jgi:hypothetical protein
LLHLFSLNTGNSVGDKGASKLFEALKSNTTLTSLNLFGNRIVTFHSHSLQVMILKLKELANYLKHSNQTQLSLPSILAVNYSFLIILLLNTGNNIGTDGGNELAKALKSNSSITELQLAG